MLPVQYGSNLFQRKGEEIKNGFDAVGMAER